MDYLILWIISIACGILLGNSKDQKLGGFVWPLLLGPLGLLIVACLPNRRAESQREEQQQLLQQQLFIQQRQLDELRAQRDIQPRRPRAIPVAGPGAFLIRRKSGAETLGHLKIAVIKTMLKERQLTLEDEFFDEKENGWYPLESNTQFVI